MKIMEPTKENQKDSTNESSKVSQDTVSKQSKKKVDDNDHLTTHVDLGKANFADRKHGRTTSSLGPGHEPGTV